jgi:Carboxypeptidase regulatory-like domain
MRRRSNSTLALLLPALCLAQVFLSPVNAQGTRQKTRKEAEPNAVIAGTVFRDPGFAQPGASVVLALKSAPTKKLRQAISSPRGEFTFRIPAGPNTYLVTAALKGFQTAREEIEIQGQEQINATLLLVPESKEKGR